jgi:hypothetical protein
MARVEDLDELRRQLGECLYVVQSFYSNTNWVEMFGGVSYPNLQPRETARRQTKQRHNAICVGHHYTETNTNNVNKT